MIQKSNIKIIAGIYKGRKLYIPSDAYISLRPTTGVIKEAIFSFLMSKYRENIVGARVLDLCAGTGALGFEALSRGAQYVEFYDSDQICTNAINRTAQELNINKNCYNITCADASKYKFRNGEALYDIIFIDPPYDNINVLEGILNNILTIMSKNGLICLERRRKQNIIYQDNLEIIKTIEFMDTSVDIAKAF